MSFKNSDSKLGDAFSQKIAESIQEGMRKLITEEYEKIQKQLEKELEEKKAQLIFNTCVQLSRIISVEQNGSEIRIKIENKHKFE